MTYASRTLGFDDSDPAKFRLHCIDLYGQLGWEGLAAAFPHLKRSSFFRWRKAYLDSGKRLNSLVPISTRPRRMRQSQVSPKTIAFIRAMRHSHPRLGKAKLVGFVETFCQEQNLPAPSQSKIGDIIRQHHMFYAGKRSRRTSRSRSMRLKRTPRASSLAPGYIQLDGTKVYAIDRYYYFLTAIDVVTKQAWVKLVPTFSSKQASLLLHEVQMTSLYAVYALQTDNGSEFAGLFAQAVASHKELLHFHSYPKSPKTNAYVERFNWTIQDEFLGNCDAFLAQQTDQVKQDLEQWLHFYHHQRPHQSLANKTPYQYALERKLVSYVSN